MEKLNGTNRADCALDLTIIVTTETHAVGNFHVANG